MTPTRASAPATSPENRKPKGVEIFVRHRARQMPTLSEPASQPVPSATRPNMIASTCMSWWQTSFRNSAIRTRHWHRGQRRAPGTGQRVHAAPCLVRSDPTSRDQPRVGPSALFPQIHRRSSTMATWRIGAPVSVLPDQTCQWNWSKGFCATCNLTRILSSRRGARSPTFDCFQSLP